jgi:ribonucleoside-diphosphate reductase alpha chain
MGAFEGYGVNREPMLSVMDLHRAACIDGRKAAHVLFDKADDAYQLWLEANRDLGPSPAGRPGPRVPQLPGDGLAPCGTIAFMMDSGHSTGIEPGIGLVVYKKLAGGGNLKIVNPVVPMALKKLGYPEGDGIDGINQIVAHIENRDTIEDVVTDWHDGNPKVVAVSGLKAEHLPVFDCAFAPANGSRSIAWQGHVKMMAACQPFLSGAISKTVNLPSDATVADIREAYLLGWRLGLKAIAIFRDGSKESQAVSTKKDDIAPAIPVDLSNAFSDMVWAAIGDEGRLNESVGECIARVIAERNSLLADRVPRRERLPDTRRSLTHKLSVGGVEAYATVGLYPDGRPGELFVEIAKEGSTVGGLMDAWATGVSIGLQYGVPLGVLVDKFSGGRFEPAGMTRNADIPIAKSLIDYIARWMGMEFIAGYREEYAPDRGQGGATDGDGGVPSSIPAQPAPPRPSRGPVAHAEVCPKCGGLGTPTGSCWTCTNCGTSIGGCG